MKKVAFKLVSIMILSILFLIGILPLFEYSYAIDKLNPGEVTSDLSRIDKNKYPGIVERIEDLKKKYPNWNFELYKTGLDWNQFIKREYAPERNISPFNLVYDTLKVNGYVNIEEQNDLIVKDGLLHHIMQLSILLILEHI